VRLFADPGVPARLQALDLSASGQVARLRYRVLT
jgi:hypothetical protein